MNYTINEETARRAKEAYSFDDYVKGSATAEYEAACKEVIELGERCKAKSYDPEKIDYLVNLFCRKYADWKNRFNANTASCPSVMITGPSNFPVRKKEKQNAREDKLWHEYRDIMDVKDKIKGVGHKILSDNPDALELLQKKLDELTALQSEMKEYNAYYRKHKTMKGFKNMTDDEAARVNEKIEHSYSGQRQPYPSFKLTNNNATIKTTQRRIEEMKAKAEQAEKPDTEKEVDGIRIVENASIDRLQFVFNGKPSDDIRTTLKANGFHWSPRENAWQRQLTNNARYAANRVLKQIA